MENNFGSINTVFLKNAESLLKTVKGKKLVKEYISKIKGDKDLLKQYSLYEFIENQSYSDNVKEYITEYINFSNSIDKKTLKTKNKELFNLLSENKSINLDVVVENSDLYSDIDGLLFNKSGIQGVKEKVSKINSIVECIKSKSIPALNETKEVLEVSDAAMTYVVSKFNDKYLDKLSPEDKDLFENLTKTTEEVQVKLFEEKKKECLNLTNTTLKEAIDNTTREKLLEVKETLLEDTYNKESFVEDILRFIELKEILSE